MLKLHITNLCEDDPFVIGGFPSFRANNVESISMWWHHHVSYCSTCIYLDRLTEWCTSWCDSSCNICHHGDGWKWKTWHKIRHDVYLRSNRAVWSQKGTIKSDIRRTKSQHFKDSRTVLRLPLQNPLKPDVKVKNEDVVGAAPTGDVSTTSEWSTMLLPTKVRLILEFLW